MQNKDLQYTLSMFNEYVLRLFVIKALQTLQTFLKLKEGLSFL